MSFCLRPNVCKKCGKPLTMFEGWTCLECEKVEQEPTTLQQIIEKHNMFNLAYDEMSDFERDILKYAEQEPKTGHWIDREVYDADRWKCSECRRTEPHKENYCPSCGAKMVEPQEARMVKPQESEDKE